MFAVRDYQAGNIIEVFDTHEEAVECLKAFEEEDIETVVIPLDSMRYQKFFN